MRSINRIEAIRIPAAMAVGLAAFLLVGVSLAEPAAHDVWLINTRCAPMSNPVGGESQILYSHLSADKKWVSADQAAFLAADDPAVPTCMFLHGNRCSHTRAVQTGWDVSQKLKLDAPEKPVRFVIWSWPADQIRGLRRDVQVKACRSDVQAYYLAQLISRINPKVRLGLIGYSYGARTITGALHMVAGGEFDGRSLPAAPVERTPVRAVLVAAAMPNYWLLPGRQNELALGQAERVLVTRNCNDPVLRWYDRMYGRGGPQALGYTGPASPSRLGEEREMLETLVLDCSVGRNHDWECYLAACSLRSRLAWYAFLEPPDEQSTESN